MAGHAPRPRRVDLRDEHIAGRKDWGAYVGLTTALHRRTVAQANELIAQVRARLDQVKRLST